MFITVLKAMDSGSDSWIEILGPSPPTCDLDKLTIFIVSQFPMFKTGTIIHAIIPHVQVS